ncbi:ADP compounds hydrolase NudE [Pseudoalteromonas luteoviolacea]|uniref:ADP-ribose diphosphatase n=1 Tax=Pseudoalteromonas luteoviolacea S4054 TaxID=1129367 RepID=A0A0F6ABL7_9GAMM|nr:ADP compounds hydrolase NudE [Pseudoalteromonas luteoviolacea]AOT06498.1 ADP compounds hydrolase NudE [Pseudoalteromonas luteoviolacea]AOT11415.1 ADP compounds hydrolase NudE [Pseudoalteromonas luteoviolacea]AOT16328.1 ADP compounds hydrolase NudE [Pseudoalteromonas luteoviolacea]KKE83236.1 ADP-ribose diphosphatase [Pseudoalteromonas luteoviolacea S4054]KZN71167.1 ADP-ribose diphosphatase [Pseudoalteromonas luteoviolacea S4047-1]
MSQKKHPCPPEIISSDVVASSRLFSVESLSLQFSNGERRQYERIKGGGRGAVMIVPITAENELLLVREYCAGTHDYQLGFPKGLIDPGETPVEAGNRELKEEVGFGANEFVDLKTVSLAPSYFKAQMHILFAKDLYPEQLEGDEPEPLVVVKWPLDDWQSLLDQSDFTEARSVAALLLLQQYLLKEV